MRRQPTDTLLEFASRPGAVVGGVPKERRKYRTERPVGSPAPKRFDDQTDWMTKFSELREQDHHKADHFVESYCDELNKILDQGANTPCARKAWGDIRCHKGARRDFEALYSAARDASKKAATDESIRAAEAAEKRRRGAPTLQSDFDVGVHAGRQF